MYKHFFKRVLDIIISLFGILIFLLPMAIISIIIKLDSKGPVLFKQKRLGKNKKIFTILKFRTMCDHAYEQGGIATSESDKRITKVGKFLRRTSLDEIPQFFNIFVGQMTIVGPRPVLDWEYEEFARPEYEDRFTVRPALFGTVDVVARNADRDTQFRMDAEYANRCTFALDFVTFFKIIKVVLSGKGVYKDEKKEEMSDSIQNHKVIVFALEHYNPLGLIRSLGENGINPVYFSIKRHQEVATHSKYISRIYRANSVEEGFQLLVKEFGNYDYNHRPIVLFSDDKSVGYFDLHYNEIKDKFICYSAGKQGRINEFMDKKNILEIAKKYGFNVLDSFVVNRGEIPDNLVYPVITKDISPNSGSWKSDVFICQNEGELIKAYETITSPQVLIQKFINKKNEYALEGFCINRGEEMMIITSLTYKYLIEGYYSPYHDVMPFNDKEMEEKLKKMFEEIGFEGIFEVEFLIDQDGTYYFLETNFRASAWNHTGSIAGMPLSYLWVKSTLDGRIDASFKKDFEPFTDMSEVIDYGKRVDGGKISLAQWLLEFKKAKGTYFYDSNDPEPFKVLFDSWEDFK